MSASLWSRVDQILGSFSSRTRVRRQVDRRSRFRHLLAEQLEDRSLLASLMFDAPQYLSLGAINGVSDIVVGNLKEDAYPDMLVSYNIGAYPANPQHVAIFSGSGPASFLPPQDYTSFPQCWGGAMELADINGDSHTDFVMSHGGTNDYCFGNKLSAHLGDGAGDFANSQVIVTGGSLSQLALGSFNSNVDSTIDILVPTYDSQQMYFHSGAGNGTFAGRVGAGPAPDDLRSLDFNGDGKLDLATVDMSPQQTQVLFGNGTGGFTANQTFVGAGSGALELADINNDGLVDIVSINTTARKINVALGVAGGSFQTPVGFSTGLGSDLGQALQVADFNLDGNPDVVFGSPTSGKMYVMTGDGGGSLAAPMVIASDVGAGGTLVARDLNGDAKVDLAYSYGQATVTGGVVLLINATVTSETDVSVVAGQLVIEDVVVGGKDDGITVSRVNYGGNDYLRIVDPNHLVCARDGAVQVDDNTVDVSLASVTSVAVDTQGGDDKLTLDYANGTFVMSVTFDGGTGLDGLVVDGGAFSNVTIDYDSAIANPETQSGVITQDGATIQFVRLEPIQYGASVGSYVFNLPGTNDQSVLGNDAPNPSLLDMLRLSSGTGSFETTDFAEPSVSLTVNLGTDDGTFYVAAGYQDENPMASLRIEGEMGDDTIMVAPEVTAGVTLRGGEGADTLEGGSGMDVIEAGPGDDVIQVRAYAAEFDTMLGGLGFDEVRNVGAADVVLDQFNSQFDVDGNGLERWTGAGYAIAGNGGANGLHFGFLQLEDVTMVAGAEGNDDITTAHDHMTPTDYDGGSQTTIDRITLVFTPDQLGAMSTSDLLALKTYLAAPSGNTLSVTAATTKGNFTATNFEAAAAAVYDDGQIIDITSCLIGIVSESQIIVGTDGADSLVGTSLADLIFGQGGDDTLDGLGGNDCIFGGAGGDSLIGGIGEDVILGGSNADWLSGGAADDRLLGGGGDDVIYGGADEDWISGGTGHDSLYGELGLDQLMGDEGDDWLSGGPDNDTLEGGPGADSVFGDAGSDKLRVRGDEAVGDLLRGGTEYDDLEIVALAGNASIRGFSGSTMQIERIMGNNQGLLGTSDNDTFDLSNVSFSSLSPLTFVSGLDGDDILIGSAFADRLLGGAGDDSLVGNGGDDYLEGGVGSDSLSGGLGNDTLDGGPAGDVVDAGGGNDVVRVRRDEMEGDVIQGGANTDRIVNTDASNPVTIPGFNALATSIEYWDGAGQGILGSSSGDTFDFRTAVGATDTYSASTVVFVNVPWVNGLGGNDTIYGTNGSDVLYGDIGQDLLYGMNANDTLYGGSDNDSLNGGAGVDWLYGGDGVDTLTGGAGGDYFVFAGDLASVDVVSDFVYDYLDLRAYSVAYAAVSFDSPLSVLTVTTTAPPKKVSLPGVLVKPAVTRFLL